MGIYIPNKELPNSCKECDFCEWTRNVIFCAITSDTFKTKNDGDRLLQSRHENCPFVNVPPHGDLIDRDAFLEKMIRTPRYFDVKFDIDEMPVILWGDK